MRLLEKLLNDADTSNWASPARKPRSTMHSPGGVEDAKAKQKHAKISHELVESVRTDLTVGWADRAATEAKIRPSSNGCASPSTVLGTHTGWWRLSRHRFRAPLVLDQAKALYSYWPDVGPATVCSRGEKWHKPSFLCRYPWTSAHIG